jgi:uncharacterized membrane protein YeaQ/YmgE (transglycosylase-associated protein family)
MGCISWIVLGGIAGWLASIVTKRNDQMGCIANIVAGIVGATVLPLAAYFAAEYGGGSGGRGWQMTIGLWAIVCVVLFVITFLSRASAFNPIRSSLNSARDQHYILDCCNILEECRKLDPTKAEAPLVGIEKVVPRMEDLALFLPMQIPGLRGFWVYTSINASCCSRGAVRGEPVGHRHADVQPGYHLARRPSPLRGDRRGGK